MQKQDCEQLTLFPADSPASRSASQESGRGGTTTVISGRKCAALLPNCDPLGLLAKMLLGSSVWQSRLVDLTWKAIPLAASRTMIITKRYTHSRSGCCSAVSCKTSKLSDTPSSRLLFRLAPSARRTGGRGCLLWATPNTMDYLPQRSPEALRRQATTSRKGRTRPANLREQVCQETVRMWPTPTQRDYKGSNSMTHILRPGQKNHMGQLANAVKMFPTPRANCGSGMSKHGDGGQDLQTAVGGQLNPAWVEWLMGFPIGWTDLNA